MIHEIKIMEQFADAIRDGKKRFEIRENDRAYQVGDLLRFTVVSNATMTPNAQTQTHFMNGKLATITYVLSGWGLKNGMVALGIAEPVEVDLLSRDELIEHLTTYFQNSRETCRPTVEEVIDVVKEAPATFPGIRHE